MQALVFINPSAGTAEKEGGESYAGKLQNLFAEVGIAADVRCVAPDKLPETLRQSLKLRPALVAVGGGDGTISLAAGILADTGIPLGVLPLGTLNHFSKDIGVPEDPAEAIRMIGAGNVTAVDVGELNGRVFINNCSLGAYPAAVRRRDELRRSKGHGKWPAMALAWWDVLRRLGRIRVSLTHDGQSTARRTPSVLISNNRYDANLFSRSMRKQVDGGKLWVYTTRVHRFFPLLRLAIRAAFGRLSSADDFESWPVSEMKIDSTTERFQVGIDGEVATFTLPLRFKIRPGALRVFTPK